MEEIINIINNLFLTYSTQKCIIIILTIVFTNLFKKPITKKAITLAKNNNYDKSVVTKNITFIPIIICFILTFIAELINVKFCFNSISVTNIISDSLIYSGVSIGVYEAIKKQLEGFKSKNTTSQK